MAVGGLALLEAEDEAVVLGGLTEAVDAGDGGDDDHVAALEEGAGGGVAELVDLLIDVGVLGDVGVGAGEVGFGLVVVVVGDEVLGGVFGEELAELGVELGGEGLVGGDDEGGAGVAGDDVGHGEGLAAAGDAEEGLVLVAGLEALHELVYGLGLVAGHVVVGDEAEVWGGGSHIVPIVAGLGRGSLFGNFGFRGGSQIGSGDAQAQAGKRASATGRTSRVRRWGERWKGEVAGGHPLNPRLSPLLQKA